MTKKPKLKLALEDRHCLLVKGRGHKTIVSEALLIYYIPTYQIEKVYVKY